MSCNCEDIIIEVSEEGIDGNGIASIVLLSESGLTKTYRINFTNGSHFDYSLSDGNGIARIEKTSTAGLVDTYTIYMTDGVTTYTFTVTNGKDGEPGVNTWGSIEGDINDQTDLKEALDLKADKADSYTKDELDGIFDGIDNALNTKADKTDVYTKTQADNLLAAKANTADLGALATMDAIDYTSDKLTNKPTLGALASKDTVNYETEVTNKPTLGTMAAEDAADYYDKDDTDALLDEKADIIVTSASASLVHITDAAPMPVKALSAAIEPVQDLSNGDPSPTNVCPISGHSTAVVTRTGKVYDFESGTLGDSTGAESSNNKRIRTKDYIPISVLSEASNVIGIYGQGFPSGKPIIRNVHFYQANNTWISRFPPSYAHNAQTITIASADIPANAAYFRVSAQMDTAGTDVISPDGVILYVNATSVTIDLDGTRYGGTLDVLTGTLTVTHKFITFTGSNESWNYTSNLTATTDRATFDTSADAKKGSAFTAIESNYLQSKNSTSTPWNGYINNNGVLLVFLPVNAFVNASGFKTWLGSNNLQVLYPLASPVTVPLSPATLSLLLGENNLWADTGDTEVTYRADTKLYIDGQILARDLAIKSIMTNVESEMKATKNYTSGQVVIVGDSFYKLTSNVSSGSAFNVGTNCQKTDMATWILSIV